MNNWDLRDIIKAFIKEEVEKLPHKMKKSVNFGARITNIISLEEGDEHFRRHYSIGSCEGEILRLSYSRIKRLHEVLGHFFYRFDDEEQPCAALSPEWDITEVAEDDTDVKIAVDEDFAFELREKLEWGKVSMEKCLYWENGEKLPWAYCMVYANRCECGELYLSQLRRLNEKIGCVLKIA